MNSNKKLKQVVVLGMHRSGTSLVSEILSHLGVYFGSGDQFIVSNAENSRGFWERKDVRAINDSALFALGCDWSEISSFSLDALNNHQEEELIRRFESILSTLSLESDQTLIGLKEPRFCLLMPLWQKATVLDPIHVVVNRNPSAVVSSLITRNAMPLEVACYLVHRYQRELINYLRTTHFIPVNYEKLFSQPDAEIQNIIQKLGVHHPMVGLAEQKTALNCIDPRLNRSNSTLILPDNWRHLHQWYEKLSSGKVPEITSEIVIPESVLAYEHRARFKQFLRVKDKSEALEKSFIALRDNHAGLSVDHRDLQKRYTSIHDSQSQLSQEHKDLQRKHTQLVATHSDLSGQHKILQDNHSKVHADQHQLANKHRSLLSRNSELAEQHKELNAELLTTKKTMKEMKKLLGEFDRVIKLLYQTNIWRMYLRTISVIQRLKGNKNKETVVNLLYRLSDRSLQLSQSFSGKISADKKSIEFDYFESVTKHLGESRPTVSLIVLTRNGLAHLRRLFSSLEEYREEVLLEVILVDHGSDDGSLQYIKEVMDRLPIKLIAFTANHSFSFSNNFAAKRACGDILVFCNNDIIFDEPVIKRFGKVLADPAVGLVGLPLYYADDFKQRSEKIQHAGIAFDKDDQFSFERPFNIQDNTSLCGTVDVYAVTAALAACRKEDFEAVGGFSEVYEYGYEDVDLSLTIKSTLQKRIVLDTTIAAIHDESATQKQDKSSDISRRRRNNIEYLKARKGRLLKKLWLSQILEAPVKGRPYTVGLVVTESDENTAAGDYFTAAELAQELTKQFGWTCQFLSQRSRDHDWYDVEGLDCLVVLLDNYDIRKTYNSSHRLITVAWLRNWFDRWVGRAWFDEFDLALCSSDISAGYVRQKSTINVEVMRIAANASKFNESVVIEDQFKSDYCFTGSYWNAPREIENFSPDGLTYDFALYGVGWAEHQQFSRSYRGSVPYQDMPKVYAGTNLLVDDANHVTKPWGSVNSRVFDALAAGKLVITNGELGATETFGTLLPTYYSIDELTEKVAYFLDNAEERRKLASRLQQCVLNQHTYSHRAQELKAHIKHYFVNTPKVAIKVPVPDMEQANEWGDYHFGMALAESLRQCGYLVRVDILPDWYCPSAQSDDVVLVIRGLSEYKPVADQHNIMWQISHPDKVALQEYEQYDQIYVASEAYARTLQGKLTVPVEPLLQCTDPTRFPYLELSSLCDNEKLFVGNSRKQLRPLVDTAIQDGLAPRVYGTRWEGLIDQAYVAGTHIPNEELSLYYSTCGVLLNDHWDSMKQHGFLSNRLFDAASCGATVVSDYVEGIDDFFSGLVYCYRVEGDSLADVVSKALMEKQSLADRRKQLSKLVQESHSFDARAKTINEHIRQNLYPFSG